jgi:hypothetical protein
MLFVSSAARRFGRAELWFPYYGAGVHARVTSRGNFRCELGGTEAAFYAAFRGAASPAGVAGVLSVYFKPEDERAERAWRDLQRQAFVRGVAEEGQQACAQGHMERRQCGLHLKVVRDPQTWAEERGPSEAGLLGRGGAFRTRTAA